MALPYYKTKRIRFIFIVYWFLLAYIVVALVFWFIELNKQNKQMARYQMEQLKKDAPQYFSEAQKIDESKKRKIAQYIGEGSIFLVLILTGAFYIVRALRRQFKQGQQQQNFMMAITHELKTPIAITKLNLETLQKRKLDETHHQRLIQNTIQEADRLNALCNNMLLASQIEAGSYTITKEEINLSELSNECVHDFKIRFPQRIINTVIDEDVFVRGDRLLLQMAINNLIDNAIKYSPKESIVTVLVKKENNLINLSIKDEGKGIAETEKKKVFDKFYRISNKEAKGTGLGLYLTKKIAQQHKANIFVTDNIPAGSKFTILFKNDI
jgi:two-component system, OmpR family, sensor histidine kinase CiaH